MSDRLARQFAFLNEADRLKAVERASVLMSLARPENVAEHSWHLALYALVMADDVPPGVDVDRVIAMLLLHDLVEIDVGDHPIHLEHDPVAVAQAEDAAALRIFGLLPEDQGMALLALWREFEAAETADARFAKRLDHTQPIFQVLHAPDPLPDHLDVVRDNLATGRAARFRAEWPEVHALASSLLVGAGVPEATPADLLARLGFLAEADRLKSVYRATTLVDGSRPENSGEHSWHLALYALVLGDQAGVGVNLARVIRMLLIHDLVEIDVGDVPIHSANGQAHASADTQAAEAAAAERLFGLLPGTQGAALRALWHEFEAAETPDAVFAKSLDRVQPVMANLMSGGGTWITYQVTAEQLESRVGAKVARGAPGIWHWVRAQTRVFFEVAP
ncbi:putative hydrolases of HD superfamily [Gemmobacter aquatilis]|uniref:5'-deoxynucleotidase n=1 Tax=Gemmobacter aquatilis TaxID=933059 RepID=A0A1H8GCF7_9RHOB|nr:HD domain-containing protein [Gemmobacter aquatilis]SEN41519.1 putative hydrolases of HD superfamily [Gemmobacter aquatilis]